MGRKSALAGWLRELDAPEIRDILALRRDAADSRPHTLRALADSLSAPASVRLAVEGLDQACRDVLDTAVRLGDGATAEALASRLRCTGKASRAELKRALAELRARALVWPVGGRLVSAPGVRLLDPEPRRITPAPRPPRRTSQHRGFADRAAITPATSTVDGVTRLVELCDTSEVTCRAGLGLRELRRVAAVLRADENRARLWAGLAAEARLLAVDDGRLLPTGASDAWRTAPPPDRLTALVCAWPRMAWAPDRQRPALAEPTSDAGDRVRLGVLEAYTRLAEDQAFEHRHEVVAELVWSRPALHTPEATEAALVEAESIGLVALGAATALGRAALGRAALGRAALGRPAPATAAPEARAPRAATTPASGGTAPGGAAPEGTAATAAAAGQGAAGAKTAGAATSRAAVAGGTASTAAAGAAAGAAAQQGATSGGAASTADAPVAAAGGPEAAGAAAADPGPAEPTAAGPGAAKAAALEGAAAGGAAASGAAAAGAAAGGAAAWVGALGGAVLGTAGSVDGVAAVARRFVPPAATTAHLRPDLTAAVAGLPSRELSEVLDLVADATGGGWRFSGASVRRALDAGHDADALLGRLASVAEHGVPQALEHLVREAARQHGRITVTPVACCVRTDDPALLREIARHRSLARLSLQLLGPTVLASARPADETLALLRAAGYAPTTSTPDGTAVVERAPRRRVEASPPRKTTGGWRDPLTDQELAKLAVALVDRERPRPTFVTPPAESRKLGTARLLRDQSLVLPDSEVVLLAEALVTRTSVEIAVANGPKSTVKHVITPVDHAAGNLKARGFPRGEHREFLVGHIRSVRAVTNA